MNLHRVRTSILGTDVSTNYDPRCQTKEWKRFLDRVSARDIGRLDESVLCYLNSTRKKHIQCYASILTLDEQMHLCMNAYT
jgi:hypothetical protein